MAVLTPDDAVTEEVPGRHARTDGGPSDGTAPEGASSDSALGSGASNGGALKGGVLKASFAADLTRFGPGSTGEPLLLGEARAYTRRLAASHYENFPVLTRLLPRRLRQPVADVYAFCRWADDLGDEVDGAEQSLELLGWWRSELERCLGGEAEHPVFVALEQTARDFQLPGEEFHKLIDAFEQDQTVTAYDTFEQLLGYCSRSADPVGRLVLHLGGAASEENVRMSDSVCSGLQLANFWQDVSRDAAIGRRYLPAEDCERFGYTEAMHARCAETGTSTEPFVALLRHQVDRTRTMLEDGRPLASRVPGRLGLAVEMFRRGGLAVCGKIERLGHRTWERRPVVGKGDALAALPAAAWTKFVGRVGNGGRG